MKVELLARVNVMRESSALVAEKNRSREGVESDSTARNAGSSWVRYMA